MRLVKLFFIGCALLIFSCSFLYAEPARELTGEEWTKMMQDEKFDFVKSIIQFYKDEGVTLSKPASFYVYSLDTTIPGSSEYESEKVADLLNTFIYKNEPAVQEASNRSKATPTKIEMH